LRAWGPAVSFAQAPPGNRASGERASGVFAARVAHRECMVLGRRWEAWRVACMCGIVQVRVARRARRERREVQRNAGT
jgi:hypothetical protein